MNKKTTWNLELLYKNDKDPRIEQDLVSIEKACTSFEKKYRNKDYTKTPELLAKAFKDYESLMLVSNHKPWWYFALRTHLNSADTVSQAQATKFRQRILTATNRTTFFNLRIGNIPKKDQKKFLAHPLLKIYKYALSRIFEAAKYNMSEKEEQLEAMLSQTSYDMWVEGQEKLLNAQMVEHKGKKIPFSEARAILGELPRKDRQILGKKLNQIRKSISHFAEAEINAVYSYKSVMDKRRGYVKPYSSTVLSYENDEKTVEALVASVTKYFHISHRFYKLHAKLLGDKKVTMFDCGAKIGKIQKKFDFDTTVDIVRGSFSKINKIYSDVLDRFLENGQIDVYPNKGKHDGAYCWGMGSTLPIFVLLNHADTIRSVETLAHEMGHAIHGELSHKQPVLYQSHPATTGEVASTFFEQALVDDMENFLSEKERIVLLHNKINADISTVFRQIAGFNFELELHEAVRKNGQVSAQQIAQLLQKHLKSYVGPAIDVTEDDGYVFVSWSHIRLYFYMYTYAFGQLVSRALYENWKKDPSYEEKIRQFLSAGRSMSPEDIFKKAGIDISDPKFFEAGLKGIERDIIRLEKMTAKSK